MYETPVAKNRSVTLTLSWTGTDSRNLVSIFTIFGQTKLISSLRSSVVIRVNVLWCSLNTWHFKSANKRVPLYTVHRPLSVQFLLPPASFSSLSSSERRAIYKYEGRASYLYRRHPPTRSSEYWWITGRSPFARMRTVLSKTKPWGEQNRARLCNAVKVRQNAPVCTWPNRL